MLILHEIGHTLGLTHNMRASQLQPDVFDEVAVAAKGLSGSVMDYEAVNVAPPGKSQTPFYQNRPGLYDYWAIEYGYSPGLTDAAAEQQRLQTLLSRSTEPELVYGNDADDMRRLVVVLIRISISMTTAVMRSAMPNNVCSLFVRFDLTC